MKAWWGSWRECEVKCAVVLCFLLVTHVEGAPSAARPNILFLIDESTDGRAYFIGRDEVAPMELPNLKGRMAKSGMAFNNSYVAAPVCCPSRAALWSGKHVHKIPHRQDNKPDGLSVRGAWNNFEGLPNDYNMTITDILKLNGYATKIAGKTDWSAGGHSVDARVTAWTDKVKFPYTLKDGSPGWIDEPGPLDGLHVEEGNKTQYEGDWDSIHSLGDWITQQGEEQRAAELEGAAPQPWFAYGGLNIVHPPYRTNTYWLDKVNQSRIVIPEWEPLSEMHPQDFIQTMKKNLASSNCCTEEQIRQVRAIYYAELAEYDSMVGYLLDVLESTGQADNTIVISTSDHGDMQMEHRQYYKMTYFDASARVPLIISGPGVVNGVINNLTSSLDLMPTILELAGAKSPSYIDGQSLVPFLTTGKPAQDRRDHVASQFHGDDIGLSWFLLRQGPWKYVVYGDGTDSEALPRLWNIDDDPNETKNLATSNPDIVQQMDSVLRTVIPYPAVAEEVESYNKESFAMWRSGMTPSEYNATMEHIRWKTSWDYDPAGAFAAVEAWMQTPNTTALSKA